MAFICDMPKLYVTFSSDPVISPSSNHISSTALTPQSTSTLTQTPAISQTVEPLPPPPKDPSVLPSNSRQASSSSVHSHSFSTHTRHEDADTTGGSSSPIFRTVDVYKMPHTSDNLPTDPESPDLLDYLLAGAAEFNTLFQSVQSVQTSFHFFERGLEKNAVSDQESVVIMKADVKAVINGYIKAIKSSVKTVRIGIAFADDVVSLCDYLSQHPNTDIRSFLEEMRQIAQRVHADANETYEKFHAIQQTMTRIPTVDTKRQSRKKNYGPGHKMRDSIIAVATLRDAADDLTKLVSRIHHFVKWWSQAETCIAVLNDRVVFAHSHRMTSLRIAMVRKRWEGVKKEYMQYKDKIATLEDFHSIAMVQTSVSLGSGLRKKWLSLFSRS